MRDVLAAELSDDKATDMAAFWLGVVFAAVGRACRNGDVGLMFLEMERCGVHPLIEMSDIRALETAARQFAAAGDDHPNQCMAAFIARRIGPNRCRQWLSVDP
jgi:hypothetical protein